MGDNGRDERYRRYIEAKYFPLKTGPGPNNAKPRKAVTEAEIDQIIKQYKASEEYAQTRKRFRNSAESALEITKNTGLTTTIERVKINQNEAAQKVERMISAALDNRGDDDGPTKANKGTNEDKRKRKKINKTVE